MFSKGNNIKVKFQDQQLDDYVLENSVLKSKLQSKIAALSIMSKELDKCSMERDRYKVIVEQLQNKNTTNFQNNCESTNLLRLTQNNSISGGQLLANTREQNNMLKLEVETLRSKLEEALGDIVALRKQLHVVETCSESNQLSTMLAYSTDDYEELVQQTEKIHKKYQQLQLDYRATLDEKEEIIQDRDYYKGKVQRLNHQITYIMNTRAKMQGKTESSTDPPKPIVDLDALVTENKYLHESITQLQVEKEIIKRNLTKYKNLLENRSKSDSLNLKRGFLDVMTQKQVREYLDINSKTGLKRTSASELKSICMGLFEALNDKSIALQHQRKTNQILANRITELEKTLENWCDGQKYIPIFPSQMLLEEFLPENGQYLLEECTDIDHRQNNKENSHRSKSDSDSADDINRDTSDESSDGKNGGYYDENSRLGTKTVLPAELEELVKEALAELRPCQ